MLGNGGFFAAACIHTAFGRKKKGDGVKSTLPPMNVKKSPSLCVKGWEIIWLPR